MQNLIALRPKPTRLGQPYPSNGGLMPEPLCPILLASLQGPALPVEGRDE